MTDSEIVKSFYEGYSIDALTKKKWAEQKTDRLERQESYRRQRDYVKAKREEDKDFKLPKSERVVVGPPATRFLALSVVEQAIYRDLKKNSAEPPTPPLPQASSQ